MKLNKNSVVYNKILIVGAGGSGKTTLGKKIGTILKIPSKSIDELRYSKDFTVRFPDKKANSNLKKVISKSKWILDGVYAKDYISPVFKKAELIIVLQTHRLKLIYRIIKRDIKERRKYKNKPFSDLFKLLYWSQKYKGHNETKHLFLAKKHKKPVIFLRTNKEISNFLESLKNN